MQYSNLYHQNEITAILDKDETVSDTKAIACSLRVRSKKDGPESSFPPEVMYSVVKKPKKSKSRYLNQIFIKGSFRELKLSLHFSDHLQQSSNIILSVQDAEEEDPELLLEQQQEDEISLEGLFPDPNDFVPPSPTFTFPPLPPTPPDNEPETETVTESTGRTEIEVSQYKPDLIQFTQKKQHKSEKVFQETKKHQSQNEYKAKSKQKGEKKKSRTQQSTSQNQLPVPTVQIMQQGSSEREIMDSIALTKNKLERKEEKHSSRSSSRKSKRKRERKENMRPSTAEPETIRREKEFCEKCYEKKMRRRMEKERERELAMRSEEQIVYDPEEPFVDRQIEEAEVLRRYIETEKVYDDTISIKSYCACSLHAEEHVSPFHVTRDTGHVSPFKLSQQKLEQVRDAVLVVRNWKHSKEAEK